jgi:hypothetical protein
MMSDVSGTPPPFKISKVLSTLMSKGIGGALDDPEQGPHVHLTLLLIAILLVSGLIILATSFFM